MLVPGSLCGSLCPCCAFSTEVRFCIFGKTSGKINVGERVFCFLFPSRLFWKDVNIFIVGP